MKHVFVSYSREDTDFAQLLKEQLQKSDIQTWLAIENLKAGEDWREGIDDAIRDSFVMLVIITPSSDESKYVTYEWAFGYGIGVPIVPVLYKKHTSHPRLESLQYEDFTNPTNRPWDRLIDRIREIHNEAIQRERNDPKIEGAINALGNWDSNQIIRAAEFLGQNKAQSAVLKLIELLEDRNLDIQRAAIRALGEIGAKSSVDRIIELLSKEPTHWEALKALGKINDPKSQQALLTQLASDDCRTKSLTISGLKNFQNEEVKTQLLKHLASHRYECDETWNDDDDEYWDTSSVLDTLIDALLLMVSEEDNIEIISIVQESDNQLQTKALRLISSSENQELLNKLLILAENEPDPVQKAAINAIGRTERTSNIHIHINALNDDDFERREKAINFFYQQFGLQGLRFALALPKGQAYWEIVSKFEEVYQIEDIEFIRNALGHRYTRVRGMMAELIRRLEIKECCDELKNTILDDNPFVRGLGIRTVGDLGCSGNITKLRKSLKDEATIYSNSELEIRDYAAVALGKLRHMAALPRLQELSLEIEYAHELREEATNLLIDLGEVYDIEKVKRAALTLDPRRRSNAIKLLEMLCGELVHFEELVRDFNDADEDLQEQAEEELTNFFPPIGLILTLDSPLNHRGWETAHILLNELEDEDVNWIKIALSSEHLHRAKAFLAYVVGLRPELGINQELVPLLNHESSFVRGHTISAIGKLAYKVAKPQVKKLLDDTATVYSNNKARVKDFAAIALARMEEFNVDNMIEVISIAPFIAQRDAQALILNNRHDFSETARNAITEEMFALLDEPVHIKHHDLSSVIFFIGVFGKPGDAQRLLKSAYFDLDLDNEIVAAIIRIGDETIVQKAITLLDSDNMKLRNTAINILSEFGDKLVADHIIKSLEPEYILQLTEEREEPSQSWREEQYLQIILQAIGKLKAEQHIPFLNQIITKSGNPAYKVTAIKSLGAIATTQATNALISHLDNTSSTGNIEQSRVCDLAADELQRIGTDEAVNALGEWNKPT